MNTLGGKLLSTQCQSNIDRQIIGLFYAVFKGLIITFKLIDGNNNFGLEACTRFVHKGALSFITLLQLR